MQNNKGKHFTIMIIPHSEKKSVVINVPVYIFKFLSIALVMASIFSIMFIKQYYDYREEAKYAQRSKVENKSLTREFASVAKDAIELKDKVARIEELDQEIRKANEFDPTKSFFSSENKLALSDEPKDKSKVTASSVIVSEAQVAVQEVKESLPIREESLENLQELLLQRNERLAAVPSIWPTNGKISSGYGYRKDPFTYRTAFHTGLDISNRVGTPVYATADGVVKHTKYDGGYGKSILINHRNGMATRYSHLSRYVVKAGDEVKKGALIGYMGNTGRSTGSHLDYEVLINGRAVDPMKYLP